ncbi:hypothetical protein J6590_043327 [Homalodisca vitripennis]|nr:hypothetical protein J6590_043327 [Homalodisca vitripennis]
MLECSSNGGTISISENDSDEPQLDSAFLQYQSQVAAARRPLMLSAVRVSSEAAFHSICHSYAATIAGVAQVSSGDCLRFIKFANFKGENVVVWRLKIPALHYAWNTIAKVDRTINTCGNPSAIWSSFRRGLDPAVPLPAPLHSHRSHRKWTVLFPSRVIIVVIYSKLVHPQRLRSNIRCGVFGDGRFYN